MGFLLIFWIRTRILNTEMCYIVCTDSINYRFIIIGMADNFLLLNYYLSIRSLSS